MEKDRNLYQVIVKVEVEINRELLDGEVESGEIKFLLKREDIDLDLFLDGGFKIRKRRKVVRRSKSVLDCSSDFLVFRVYRVFEKFDRLLSVNLYIQVELEKEEEEVFFNRKDGGELGDVKLEDLEGLDEGRVFFYKQRMFSNKVIQRLMKYRRSYFVDEGVLLRFVIFLLRDVFNLGLRKRLNLELKDNLNKNSSELFLGFVNFYVLDILVDLSRGSGDSNLRNEIRCESDRSDISVGEVRVNVKKRDSIISKRSRSFSVGDINFNNVVGDIGFIIRIVFKFIRFGGIGFKIVKFFQNGGYNINFQEIVLEQSSIVGLDCLFCTDSDFIEGQ